MDKFVKDKLAAETLLVPTEVIGYPFTLQVNGDLATQVITISLWDLSDLTATDAYDAEGSILVLSQTKPTVTFYGPVVLKLSKPVTTNNVNVTVVRAVVR